MEPAEREAVVEQQAAIGSIDRSHRYRQGLAELLSEAYIKRSVPRQIVGAVGRRRIREAIRKSGTIIDIGRAIRAPRECGIEAQVERVPLIVIDRAVVFPPRRNPVNRWERRSGRR